MLRFIKAVLLLTAFALTTGSIMSALSGIALILLIIASDIDEIKRR